MAIKKIIIQIDMPDGNEVTEHSEEINTLIEVIQDLLSGEFNMTFKNTDNRVSSITTSGYEAMHLNRIRILHIKNALPVKGRRIRKKAR